MPVVHTDAGQLAPPEKLENIPALMSAYYTEVPDPGRPEQRVAFGTSGHRGTSLLCSFNEEHIYAITQAVCDYRKAQGIDGPLFLGGDTHALSEAAFRSALEVLTANNVAVRVPRHGAYTPTPAVSHAILRWNAGAPRALRTASSSRLPIIPRATAASSIIRPTAARPRRRSPGRSKVWPMSALKAATAACDLCPCVRPWPRPWWRNTTLFVSMWMTWPWCWT